MLLGLVLGHSVFHLCVAQILQTIMARSLLRELSPRSPISQSMISAGPLPDHDLGIAPLAMCPFQSMPTSQLGTPLAI